MSDGAWNTLFKELKKGVTEDWLAKWENLGVTFNPRPPVGWRLTSAARMTIESSHLQLNPAIASADIEVKQKDGLTQIKQIQIGDDKTQCLDFTEGHVLCTEDVLDVERSDFDWTAGNENKKFNLEDARKLEIVHDVKTSATLKSGAAVFVGVPKEFANIDCHPKDDIVYSTKDFFATELTVYPSNKPRQPMVPSDAKDLLFPSDHKQMRVFLRFKIS
jgi:hypothetical protein